MLGKLGRIIKFTFREGLVLVTAAFAWEHYITRKIRREKPGLNVDEAILILDRNFHHDPRYEQMTGDEIVGLLLREQTEADRVACELRNRFYVAQNAHEG